VALGYFIGGPLGGALLHHYGKVVHRPQAMWIVIAVVGVLTALLMLAYDKIVKPREAVGKAS
jgi:MFS family permease